MNEHLLLVDGHSIANRAFYGVPLLTNSKGQYTNALHGFFNILFSAIDRQKPTMIAVAFDLPAPTFRHDMFPEYKGNRSAMQEELKEQIPALKDMLEKAGVKLLMMEKYEADDLIGIASKRAGTRGDKVTILSGDRDLLQLVDENIMVLLPKTKKEGTEYEVYHVQDVVDKYGVEPAGYLQMKALMGDASDNIPGVPKIGEKTASKIIKEYGTVETAIAHASEIKPPMAGKNLAEYADQARLSLTLATILIEAQDVPEPEKLTDLTFHTPEFLEQIKKYELKSIQRKLLQSAPPTGTQESFREVSSAERDPFSSEEILPGQPDNLSGEKTAHAPGQGEEDKEEDSKEDLSLKQAGARFRELMQNSRVMSSTEELKQSLAKSSCTYLALTALGDDPESPEYFCVNSLVAEEDAKTILMLLKPYLEDPEIPKIFCDAKPLMRKALELGINIRGSFLDEMVAAYLLNATTGHYTPDVIASTYVDVLIPAEEELIGTGAKRMSWTMIDSEERSRYLMNVCAALTAAAPVLWNRMKQSRMLELYTEIEGPLVEVLASMENEGIRVDVQELEEIGSFLKENITQLQKEIFELCGCEFNVNSPKQLGAILFERLGLPAEKKTKTKTGYSTSAEVLEGLRPYHPVVDKILQYRQLSKLESTYVEGLKPCIREDGRIHCTFQQAVTATGRLSCTDPNLQNIPIRDALGRTLRKAFVPRDEDHFFMDADYSQIELRLAAHMSGDETMIRAYREGADIHRLTASEVLHIPYEEVTDRQRSSAKAVNFGIIYGISAFRLANDLGMSNKEASKYIEDYFARFPGVKKYLTESVAFAKEKGYGVTIFGRRRQIDELKAKNFALRSFGERVAMNMPIQGSAADIMKIAMVKVYRRLKESGLGSRLILQVHDELMIEVLRGEEGQVKAILTEEMQGAAGLQVPLTVEVETGENWYEAK
ncbi:MAG: DNA polymerase I [Lachnospiraceae bacterium]|nr:DNA polymerase I [Lachnospiraceae bacterium]